MEKQDDSATTNQLADPAKDHEQDVASQLKTTATTYYNQTAKHKDEGITRNDVVAGGADETINMDMMLTKYKALALNKEIHPVIVNDPLICPVLVLLLDGKGSQVLQCLEILHLLAMNPANARKLDKVLHLHDGLKAVAVNVKQPNEIRDFAQQIHETIRRNRRPILKARTGNTQRRVPPPTLEPVPSKAEYSGQGNAKRNQSISKGKCVELYAPFCIFKDKRVRMTEALLTLNGILSITYDMKKCYCLLRVKSYVTPELLGKTIANLGFECHLVTKAENQEVMIKMDPDPKLENSLSIHDQENLGAGRRSPQYLSDSDSELSFHQAQVVAKVSNEGSKENKGWLSSAAGFFQKSFYW